MGAERFQMVKSGPVPDRLVVWPMEDGRYGLDATFQGVSGYDRAHHYEADLNTAEIKWTLVQELTDGWTLRFGPVDVSDIRNALDAFLDQQ